ncbi:uncharacterized protein YegP (UPF0339 family) [Catenuloplanes nepalensis]|uniref:Uncharacterized protein YegP (UPF0339 family) n=1 Tax=Catenuloplanes nepalensis TaxID=587533 RepID=A0ABT9N3Y7_9ACTN|nr:uncharacterized protein YegP (UPF0339 family) [Catenuloplanes nepalensis]
MTEDEFDAMLAESEPVELTGPPAQIRPVTFELISGDLRAYRWRLVAADGEILATSATSYRSADEARRVLTTLMAAMQRAPIVEADGPAAPQAG